MYVAYIDCDTEALHSISNAGCTAWWGRTLSYRKLGLFCMMSAAAIWSTRTRSDIFCCCLPRQAHFSYSHICIACLLVFWPMYTALHVTVCISSTAVCACEQWHNVWRLQAVINLISKVIKIIDLLTNIWHFPVLFYIIDCSLSSILNGLDR